MRFVVITFVCVLASACSKTEPVPDKFVPLAPPKTSTTAITAKAQEVFEEPPESVLRDFMFAEYARIEAAGGMPATVTASGKGGVIRAKLFSVTKDECHQNPAKPSGVFDCSVSLMGTMWWEGQREPTKPLSSASRMSVAKNSSGNWVDCSDPATPKQVCNPRPKG